MREAPASQFVLRVAADDAPDGAEVIEEIALALRGELADAGALRVDQVPLAGAPEGARGLEVLAVCSFIITAVQAGESMSRVVAAIRRVVDRYTPRRPVRVSIAGIDVDLAGADDDTTARIVRALLAAPVQPATGVRDALVIANARYDDPGLARLRSPGHDAEALAGVLGDPAVGGFRVESLVDADERTIRRRIAAFFADRDRDDLLLLHFSCHGVKDMRGRLHLATRDTDLSVLGATSVPASFVHDALNETQSRRVVLILDCCYSGAFARGAAVRSGNDVHIADEFGAGSGRVVLTASSATEYAFEGGELIQDQAQPSVFTTALVDGLRSGAADLDADGEIGIDELYDYTYRRVREATPGQAPMKWSFGVEGSLTVARSVRPAALPRSIVDDLHSDRVVLRLEAIRGLAQLSTSTKPGLRAAALDALARVRDTDDSVQVRRAAAATLGADTPAGTTATDVPDPVRPHPAATVVTAPPPRPPSPPYRPAERSDGLVITAGLLIPVSVLLHVVAIYGITGITFTDDWHHNLIWLVQFAGAALLLASRHARWTWCLLGVLAWAWIDLVPNLHSSARSFFGEAWGFLVTADLVAIAAQICLIVAVVRDRDDRTRPDPLQVAAAVPASVLAVATTLLLTPLLYQAWDLDTSEGGALRTLAAIICAAAIPAAVVATRTASVGWLLPVGWLIGGAELMLTISINLSRYGMSEDNRSKVTVLWIVLLLTAGLTIVARFVSRRPDESATPGER